jgi:hypothetical protein
MITKINIINNNGKHKHNSTNTNNIVCRVSMCVCVCGVVKIPKKGILRFFDLVLKVFGLTRSELWVPEDYNFIVAQCMRFTP